MKKYQAQSKRSFGLIETVIAGVVVITVVAASVMLRQKTGDQASIARHTAQAYLLAQEGIEAVRNIRDTNYLSKRYDAANKSYVKSNWLCDLTYKPDTHNSMGTPAINYLLCDTSTANNLSGTTVNSGNFISNISSINGEPYELGNGGENSLIFRDTKGGDTAQVILPAWSLSSGKSGTPYDAGGFTGFMMQADNQVDNNGCNGIERVFMRDIDKVNVGDADPADSRVYANAINGDVRMNRRVPGEKLNANQDNYWNYTNGSTCFNREPPSGYYEFDRQVTVSAVDFTTDSNMSPGNIPQFWYEDSSNGVVHMVKVLVRVSWKETSRYTALGDRYAVLLATYLTDWRPTN